MKKILNKVTVTGADESGDISLMKDIQDRFPFVEWGILLSRSSAGKTSRFPSIKWIDKLLNSAAFNVSGHICGSWVKEICKGNWSIAKETSKVFNLFSRLQLNFHAIEHDIPDKKLFLRGFDEVKAQIIFQQDGTNDKYLDIAVEGEIDAVGLYDLSHGAGILPDAWPENKTYLGYAGGLSPDNLEDQLNKISEVCTPPIWIDAETHLRSNNDRVFDLKKVERFLEIAKPWVI